MDDGPAARSRHPVFARCYSALAPLGELAGGASLRAELLAGLSGVVVEVGAGSGLNFAHYPKGVTSVIAVEPEPHLRHVAVRAAGRAPVPISVRDARAESLPLADGSVEAGVTALVLCSVDDPGSALGELHRVIKVGGELRFYEHIRGGRLGGALQDTVDPAWSLLAGGCHLNRDTQAEMVNAGFVITQLRRVPTRLIGVRLPGPAVIVGRARRS
ncbi:MAG TPA: class I SAM-dependent methyltransferase [Candidatus Dormibacteraeota bacterium]|nr:class I SAM-dependent methyltransferase [Candidatus Dormibacteraeota bacterium]